MLHCKVPDLAAHEKHLKARTSFLTNTLPMTSTEIVRRLNIRMYQDSRCRTSRGGGISGPITEPDASSKKKPKSHSCRDRKSSLKIVNLPTAVLVHQRNTIYQPFVNLTTWNVNHPYMLCLESFGACSMRQVARGSTFLNRFEIDVPHDS